jgi:hypothetical protein
MKIDFKKFKVAVCFSGQLRSFKDCYNIIKRNLIDCFEGPDIFVTTWDNDPNILDSKFFYNLSNNVTIKNVPITDHKPLTDSITNVFPRSCKLNILNQLFLLKECNILKKNAEKDNNFKYDLVFRCRPDIIYQTSLNSYNFELLKFLDKSHLSDNINDMNKLFCIVGEPEHWPQDLKNIVMNDYIKPIDDIIYFGSSEKMNIVCERYDYLNEYCKNSYTLHPELFFGYTAFSNIKKEDIYRMGYPRMIIR